VNPFWYGDLGNIAKPAFNIGEGGPGGPVRFWGKWDRGVKKGMLSSVLRLKSAVKDVCTF